LEGFSLFLEKTFEARMSEAKGRRLEGWSELGSGENVKGVGKKDAQLWHGTDVRGLEEQVAAYTGNGMDPKEPILARVRLPLAAAIFAVRYITQFVGLDAFSIFRDEHNLGAVLREFMYREPGV
jgi:hypothetical protein